MARYEYVAVSTGGNEVRGTITADDEDTAVRELAARKLKVLDIVWCPAVDSKGGLHNEEITTLMQTVGGAAIRRVPLEVSLAALAEEKDDPRLAATAEQLALRLKQGATIDEALASLDRQLPVEVAGLLRSGVESGDLAGSLERFGQQQLVAERFNRRIRSALAYPLIILIILIPLLLFLSLYVIPMFGDIFREFDLELPVITELILQTAKQLPGVVVGVLLLVVGVPVVMRVLGGRWLLHRFRTALPFFGRLWMWAGQREFAAQLSSFLNLGVPMPTAIAHTAQVMSDRNIARACNRVSRRVESGQTLSNSLGQSIHFDRSLVALVNWGENHVALPEALAIATEMFEDHIDQQASFVRRLLPPLTLVFVATLMFYVIIGLIIPLVKLIEGLSQ